MLLQITEPLNTPKQDVEAIGIDLGTTNSVVAYSRNKQVIILKENEFENDIVPSVVAYTIEGTVLIGDLAKNTTLHPKISLWSLKRLMGQPPSAWAEIKHLFPYLVRDETETSILKFKIYDRSLTIIEITAELLKYLKKRAEQTLETPIDKAVITVPAYFDEAARQATKDAAKIAGLEVLRLINEPTAASFAYGLDKEKEGIYGVYDLGGGTFDFSILKMEKGIFQVLATGGHTSLGGDDIDRLILHHIYETLPTNEHYDEAIHLARHAKEYLSIQEAGSWTFPEKEEPVLLNRFFLERLMSPLIEQTLDVCKRVILDAHISLPDFKGIVLVGGMTKTPFIQERIKDYFGQPPLCDLDPDRIVAMGAALQAESLTHGMDPLLLDVTPLSLGIETMGGIVERIIPRNTPLPTSTYQDFTTFKDNQTAIKIHIVQGERELVQHCRSLGDFILKDVPPMPAGKAKLRVQFDLDADGLLSVSAIEQTSGKAQTIVVQSSYGLTRDDLEKMIYESMKNAKEDIDQRILHKKRVDLERMISYINQQLKDDQELSEEEKKHIIESAKKAEELLTKNSSKIELDPLMEDLMGLTQDWTQRRLTKALRDKLSS